MNDEQFRRYSRHILLEEVDEEGQERLLNSHALIIGIGGLGSAASMYLASSGVGTLSLCDFDSVDLSNLQRQVIHNTDSIGKKKVDSAQEQIARLNPNVNINTYDVRLNSEELQRVINNVDIVLDASDNFATRYLLNKLCHSNRTPLVSGAAIRFEGHITTLLNKNDNSTPCYSCLYPEDSADEGDTCDQLGVLAPLTGVIGSLQAAEAIKVLAQFGQRPFHGNWVRFQK